MEARILGARPVVARAAGIQVPDAPALFIAQGLGAAVKEVRREMAHARALLVAQPAHAAQRPPRERRRQSLAEDLLLVTRGEDAL